MQTTLNKIFITFLSLMMFNMMYAQCDMPENTLAVNGADVWYNASSDIGGFQFNVDGATINGVSGGDAAANGFHMFLQPDFLLSGSSGFQIPRSEFLGRGSCLSEPYC